MSLSSLVKKRSEIEKIQPLPIVDTCLLRTLFPEPQVSAIDRFYCILFHEEKGLENKPTAFTSSSPDTSIVQLSFDYVQNTDFPVRIFTRSLT